MAFSAAGKLYNLDNEVVAEGSCEVDPERGTVTFHPYLDNPAIDRQRGDLRLELETGLHLDLTDRVIRYRLNAPGRPGGFAYRLSFTEAQKARSFPDLGAL